MSLAEPAMNSSSFARRKPLSWWQFTATALLVGVLGACGGAAETLGGGNSPKNNLSGGNNPSTPYQTVSIGKPSSLPALADIGDPGAEITGADFVISPAPVNISTAGSNAHFAPDWNPLGVPATYETAWGLFMLKVDGTPISDKMKLKWVDLPSSNHVWVGLANFQSNQWAWKQVPDVTNFSVPNLANYVRDSDQALAVVILVAGEQNAALTSVTAPDVADVPEGYLNDGAFMGANLESITDSSRSIVFTDVFKTARDWIPQTVPFNGTWDTGASLDLDADGYPASLSAGQAAAAVLMNNQVGNYPSGTYVCLYDGTGTIDFRGDATVTSQEAGRMEVFIDPSTSLTVLSITATDELDPIHNVRLIMPGFEESYQTQTFHPDFLDAVDSFSVLRFMDWGRTNDSPIVQWSERTTTNTFSQADTSNGVAVEYMIELANETENDMWICIPHEATDQYVTELATLIRDTLNPQLHCYVEYSNEVWNGIFDQASYAQTQGLNAGLSADPFTAQMRFYAQRSKDVFEIFETVFPEGSEQPVMTLAGQSTNPWTGLTIMAWDNVSDIADCYAVAPYFGNSLGLPANEASTLAMNTAQVLAECDSQSLTKHTNDTGTNAVNADAFGLELIAYEGGQHLVGVNGVENNQTITDLFLDANRDTGMRQLYLDDLRRWDANGGGLYMAFTLTYAPNKFGAWGVLESQNQDRQTAPKWLGIMDYIDEMEI